MTKDDIIKKLQSELEDIEAERERKIEAAQAAHLRRLQAFEDGYTVNPQSFRAKDESMGVSDWDYTITIIDDCKPKNPLAHFIKLLRGRL